jgi:hypothetical protein
MSKQQESDVRNHLSNRPSIVGSKHNSATECANPQCSKKLLYLRSGFHGSPGGQFGATVEAFTPISCWNSWVRDSTTEKWRFVR